MTEYRTGSRQQAQRMAQVFRDTGVKAVGIMAGQDAGVIADDAMASAQLAGCALGPVFRRVLVQVATGELTVDEAIRIARRDIESDLASTLDVDAGLREVLDSRRDQQL